MLKKILLFGLVILVVLAGILIFNTYNLTSKQMKIAPIRAAAIDKQQSAENLAGAIRFPTVSQFHQFYDRSKPFIELHQYLEKTYPLVHQKLKKETVSQYSLVFTWQGKNPALKPILLMGHTDVVPVDGGSEKDWQFEPFAGKIAKGYILGRGTLDDKVTVIGILEAIEALLKKNFQPERTIYLAFGHDEELSGREGAVNTVKLFASRKIDFEYILDEGGTVSEGIVPGTNAPIALVGIAEKGYVSFQLTAKGEGGHSSMPPPHTAIGELSAAIQKLENNQMPMNISGASQKMLEYLAPEMPFMTRMAVANQWLLGGLLKAQLSKTNSGNALLRTTTAATMMSGGIKDNVIPINAQMIVNFRILPGETVEDVQRHIIKTIDNQAIKVSTLNGKGNNPSPVSDVNSWGFQAIQKTIHEIFPQTIVCPNLVVGATDSRYFTGLSKNIFRFIPIRLKPEDLKRIHGTNERISVDNFAECVQFYQRLIENSAKK
ncbi:MAG: M20 family peptidase [Microscillaceae bacterium]|jgi:carboxypeptidase PM20D1|nr:M20 family peptidase [Microscillaceae bacterium]